jgi:alpha-ketoglutarate-dependent taurine dioxygenase
VAGWLDDNAGAVAQALRDPGAVLFRGFAPSGPADFGELVRRVGGDLLEYQERSSPRSVVEGRVYTSTEYPAHQSIPFHNESSYSSSWPATIAFYAEVPPQAGGETPVADVHAALAAIDPDVLDRFERLGVRYVRNLGGDLGLDWATVFQTDSRAEVDELCRAGDITPEWLDGGRRLRTTSTRPAVRRHPETGHRLWFNHALLFHVTSLGAELADTLRELMPEADLPSNTYFGDGGTIPDDVVGHLAEAYASASHRFPWREGDLLVLDNMRVAHARNAFDGPRRILTAMAGTRSDAAA